MLNLLRFGEWADYSGSRRWPPSEPLGFNEFVGCS